MVLFWDSSILIWSVILSSMSFSTFILPISVRLIPLDMSFIFRKVLVLTIYWEGYLFSALNNPRSVLIVEYSSSLYCLSRSLSLMSSISKSTKFSKIIYFSNSSLWLGSTCIIDDILYKVLRSCSFSTSWIFCVSFLNCMFFYTPKKPWFS